MCIVQRIFMYGTHASVRLFVAIRCVALALSNNSLFKWKKIKYAVKLYLPSRL